MLKAILTKTSKIAVWGIGYLGYSTLIKLQKAGYTARSWAPEAHHTRSLQRGAYPGMELQFAWSEMGSVPSLLTDRIEFVEDPKDLFAKDVHLHIVALPNLKNTAVNPAYTWNSIAETFRETTLSQRRKICVMLVAAAVPGDTDEFVRRLGDAQNLITVASAFRSDWVIEDYLHKDLVQAVGGEPEACHIAGKFLEQLGIDSFTVGTHMDSELYHACASSMQYILSTHVNQFALAYPLTDLRKISAAVMKYNTFPPPRPSIGRGGRQMLNCVEFSLRGSKYNNLLTILQEAQDFNLSSIFGYCDFLVRKNVKKICILGITPQADNADLTLSPSVLLAEALLSRDIEVLVHDPLFSFQDISRIIRGVQWFDINAGKADSNIECFILMTPHRSYVDLNQKQVDLLINDRTVIILDNTGTWENFAFAPQVEYHVIGGGTVDINL